MPCEFIKAKDGTTFIMCTRGRTKRPSCSKCGRASDFLCDWALQGEKFGKTCDRPLCGRCRHAQPNGKDFCPAHHALAEKARAEASKPPEPEQQHLALFPPPKLAVVPGGKRGQ